MKKLSIALAVVLATSAAVAADKVETVKKAPVKMSSAEMSKVVAGRATLNDTNFLYTPIGQRVGDVDSARPINPISGRSAAFCETGSTCL